MDFPYGIDQLQGQTTQEKRKYFYRIIKNLLFAEGEHMIIPIRYMERLPSTSEHIEPKGRPFYFLGHLPFDRMFIYSQGTIIVLRGVSEDFSFIRDEGVVYGSDKDAYLLGTSPKLYERPLVERAEWLILRVYPNISGETKTLF